MGGGVFYYLSYIYNKKLLPKDYPQYLSIAATVKNEAPYLAEWIEYHLLIGVEKFYIYDNDSTDNIKQILSPYINEGIVEYTFWTGKAQQISIYNNAVRKLRLSTFWLAFIDIDEFIVPISTTTIPEFLSGFEKYPAVEINWMLYGSGGQKNKIEGLVTERFKDHSLPEFWDNRKCKSILHPLYVLHMNIHDAIFFDLKHSVNSNEEENLRSGNDRNPLFDKIRINHYYTKSYEEFLEKCERGDVSTTSPMDLQLFYERDKNNIKDDKIMNKYIPIILMNLQKRQR